MKERRETFGRGRWIWVVAIAGTVILGAGAGAWLLVEPLAADAPADRAKAMQATFTIAFGFGGLATLALFARRQWLQERVHAHDRQVAADAKNDAEQKRITEQYIKAVEQIGHTSPSVRLGGLYALDRLGRKHSDQRQVVADVWCAYLRRRYRPPKAVLTHGLQDPLDDLLVESSAVAVLADAEDESEAAALDEYEVRATAQRLLARHLKDPRPPIWTLREDLPPASEEYWNLQRVDLSRATLVDADFQDCIFPDLEAGGLRCHDPARFNRAVFTGEVNLQRAQFLGPASFPGARFLKPVALSGAVFLDRAAFPGVVFAAGVDFAGAMFAEGANMERTRFRGAVNFDNLSLPGRAVVDLREATVSDNQSCRRTWPGASPPIEPPPHRIPRQRGTAGESEATGEASA